LGNITADARGVARFAFPDSRVHLSGPWSVIGRAVAVASGRDDAGARSTTVSKVDGSAGPPAAWGVIGLVLGTAWGDSVEAQFVALHAAGAAGAASSDGGGAAGRRRASLTGEGASGGAGAAVGR
jgi:hypothetical protein